MKAVYPGSFDPVTFGHLDIIRRSAQMFESLTVAVLINVSKKSLFSADERREHLKELTMQLPNVNVISYDGLLTKLCLERDYGIIIRGVRNTIDFNHELNYGLANKNMHPNPETIMLPVNPAYLHISSSIVKEIFSFKGDVSEMVPSLVMDAMYKLQTGES